MEQEPRIVESQTNTFYGARLWERAHQNLGRDYGIPTFRELMKYVSASSLGLCSNRELQLIKARMFRHPFCANTAMFKVEDLFFVQDDPQIEPVKAHEYDKKPGWRMVVPSRELIESATKVIPEFGDQLTTTEDGKLRVVKSYDFKRSLQTTQDVLEHPVVYAITGSREGSQYLADMLPVLRKGKGIELKLDAPQGRRIIISLPGIMGRDMTGFTLDCMSPEDAEAQYLFLGNG